MSQIEAISEISSPKKIQVPFPNNNQKLLAKRIYDKNMELLQKKEENNIKQNIKRPTKDKIQEKQMYQIDQKKFDQANTRRMHTSEVMGLKQQWIQRKD